MNTKLTIDGPNFFNWKNDEEGTIEHAVGTRLYHNGQSFARYATPNGWKKTAHWYSTKEEASNAFESLRDIIPPDISQDEIDLHSSISKCSKSLNV
jgi:hypothetical protein